MWGGGKSLGFPWAGSVLQPWCSAAQECLKGALTRQSHRRIALFEHQTASTAPIQFHFQPFLLRELQPFSRSLTLGMSTAVNEWKQARVIITLFPRRSKYLRFRGLFSQNSAKSGSFMAASGIASFEPIALTDQNPLPQHTCRERGSPPVFVAQTRDSANPLLLCTQPSSTLLSLHQLPNGGGERRGKSSQRDSVLVYETRHDDGQGLLRLPMPTSRYVAGTHGLKSFICPGNSLRGGNGP